MKKGSCSICLAPIDTESADILTMGAYGTPKCICDECSGLMKTATEGREYNSILEAMNEITDRMSEANIDDPAIIATVAGIFDPSKERAEAILEGTYDFSLDGESADDVPEDVPEELLETEEDKELDRIEAEKSKKWDKILNWFSIGVIIAALGFVIWNFLK